MGAVSSPDHRARQPSEVRQMSVRVVRVAGSCLTSRVPRQRNVMRHLIDRVRSSYEAVKANEGQAAITQPTSPGQRPSPSWRRAHADRVRAERPSSRHPVLSRTRHRPTGAGEAKLSSREVHVGQFTQAKSAPLRSDAVPAS
jgi:hypothetical protein